MYAGGNTCDLPKIFKETQCSKIEILLCKLRHVYSMEYYLLVKIMIIKIVKVVGQISLSC